ncbi:hypothetical protein BDV10DRAFT_33855 [Aspergillus recurvatus]
MSIISMRIQVPIQFPIFFFSKSAFFFFFAYSSRFIGGRLHTIDGNPCRTYREHSLVSYPPPSIQHALLKFNLDGKGAHTCEDGCTTRTRESS